MFRRMMFAFIASAFLISGCSSTLSNAQKGSIAGGLLLGAVGSQIGGGTGQVLSTVIFGILGSKMGQAIGESMDYTDKMQATRALEYKPDRQPTIWTNPNNGTQYQITPIGTRYQATSTGSEPCRDFVIRAKSRHGRNYENIHAHACRRNGEWVVQ